MSNTWQEAYQQLQNFVAANGSITIEENAVVMLADLRPEFYRLFDKVRAAFLERRYPVFANKSMRLSERYISIEREVTGFLDLDGISTSPRLHRFLHNPLSELMAEMFYLLFDLLKGRIDYTAFEQKASRNTEAYFGLLYQQGYNTWITLSIMKLLIPDEILGITHPSPEFDDEEAIIHRKLPLPELVKTKIISLEPEQFNSFIVPHFIVHSTRINRYVGFRTEFCDAADTADNLTSNREWYPLKVMTAKYGSIAINPSMLIYISDKPQDIALIADYEHICRPDLIVECEEQKVWYINKNLKKVKKEYDILKPRLGTYIVSGEDAPEQPYLDRIPDQSLKEVGSKLTIRQSPLERVSLGILQGQPEIQGRAINFLDVGFNAIKLEPVIKAIGTLFY